MGNSYSGKVVGVCVNLDEDEVIDCTLVDCELLFSGKPPKLFKAAKLDNCRWTFRGAAEFTLLFLAKMRQSGSDVVVDELLDAVRSGAILRDQSFPPPH